MVYIYWAHRLHGVKSLPVVRYTSPILVSNKEEWPHKAHYVFNLGFLVCAASGSNNAAASKAGAIGLAVVLGFVLLAAIVAFSILGYRKWKARQSSGTSFQGAPPGGAFWDSSSLSWKHSADAYALQLWCSHVGSIRHWQITSDTIIILTQVWYISFWGKMARSVLQGWLLQSKVLLHDC